MFPQGDRGKPGPTGPAGNPGERVRDHKCVHVFLFGRASIYVLQVLILVFYSGISGASGAKRTTR